MRGVFEIEVFKPFSILQYCGSELTVLPISLFSPLRAAVKRNQAETVLLHCCQYESRYPLLHKIVMIHIPFNFPRKGTLCADIFLYRQLHNRL